MAGVKEPRLVESVAEIADKIHMARRTDGLGEVIFFIGAGCSVSAGIPSAEGVAKEMTLRAARNLCRPFDGTDPVAAYGALVAKRKLDDCGGICADASGTMPPIDWYRVYDRMFATHFSGRDETRELFHNLIEQAQGAINWAHLCLGELAAEKLVSTVLTTNFDQLVLWGMVRAGLIPVVCDDIDALNRISPRPRHPQLVELHGSRHTYALRNRPDDVEALKQNHDVIGAVRGLIQAAKTFVVVGYAGREEGIMNLLVEAARSFDDKNLFWVQYSDDPKTLSEKARAFLATSRNGGLLLGRDADRFFLELCQALEIGTPSAIREPLRAATDALAKVQASRHDHADITAEIERAGRRLDVARRALETADATPDPVARLRDLRLAGKIDEAYAESLEFLPEAEIARENTSAQSNKSGAPLPASQPIAEVVRQTWELTWEAALVADERAAVDPEIASSWRAAELWRTLVGRSGLPDDRRLEAKRRLGEALGRLGARSATSEPLLESIDLFEEVVEGVDRNEHPLDWARAKSGLGDVLWHLGNRETGNDRLEQAVRAYRSALEERTRQRVPLDWAETQNNLGSALSALGERQDNPILLKQAIEAFRLALEERTRGRVPLAWAETQDNLGGALGCLGWQAGDASRLQEAVAVRRSALEVWMRDRAPLEWASAQNNLGNALMDLGLREGGTERLNQAVDAYRSAREEWTRDRAPFYWARIQYNLGIAITELARRSRDPTPLYEAAACLRAALEVRTPENDAYWHPHTVAALRNVLALRAELAAPLPTPGRRRRRKTPPRT